MTERLTDPFKPGTGAMPKCFVGRESLLETVMAEAVPLYCNPQDESAPKRDIIMWGPEGIGKTALLRRIEDTLIARFSDRNIKDATVLRWTPATELRSRANAIDAILPGGLWKDFLSKLEEVKVLGLFGLRIQLGDPPPRTLRYALAARLADGPLVILLDDAQEMKPAMAQELLSAAQLLRTKGAPLLLVLAGTAKLFSTLNKGSTAVWKRSALLAVRPLEREQSERALIEPLSRIATAPVAVDQLLDEAGDQPYRLQEIGSLVVEELQAQKGRGDERGITEALAKNVRQHIGKLDTLRAEAKKKSDVSKIRPRKEVAERLKGKNRKLKFRLAQLEAQARQLSGKLEESATENGQLRREAARLEDEKDELSRRCIEEEKRVTTLESEKARLEDEAVQQGVEAQERLRKIAELGSKNERLQERVEQMTADKDELSTLGEEQEKRIAVLKSEGGRLEGKVAQQEMEIRALSEQIAELGSKSGRLQQEIEHLKDFYQQKKDQRPTRWRWLFGDDRPPATPLS